MKTHAARLATEKADFRPALPPCAYTAGLQTEKRLNYREQLLDPRWQKKRLEIFERDGWKCVSCRAADKTLHVHHLRYERGRPPWEGHDRSKITLCADCHEAFHNVDATDILGALMAGGISLDNLWSLMGVIDAAFIMGGVKGRPLAHVEWDELIDIINRFIGEKQGTQ